MEDYVGSAFRLGFPSCAGRLMRLSARVIITSFVGIKLVSEPGFGAKGFEAQGSFLWFLSNTLRQF